MKSRIKHLELFLSIYLNFICVYVRACVQAIRVHTIQTTYVHIEFVE